MKRLMTALLVVALATGVNAQNWKVDGVHSSVYFKVSHMVVTKQKGDFKSFDGTISFDGKDYSKASVEFTVDVNSVNTDNENRDKHLKSADFFEAEKFPTITFKSTKVAQVSGNKFTITGNMTMKGVTKEVTFDAEFNGVSKLPTEMGGGTKAGFSATAKINRQDFGLTWSKSLDGGGLVVGNEVEIFMEIEADQV